MKASKDIFLLGLLALLLLIPGRADAQDDELKNGLMVSTGASIPFEIFKEKEFVGMAGFASTGANMQVDYIRLFWSGFGFSAHLGYSMLPFDERAYESEYDRILGTQGFATANVGNYQVVEGLAGFFFRIPFFFKSRLYLHWQAGYALTFHPDLEVVHSYWGTLNTVEQVSDFALMNNPGIRLERYITEQYRLHLYYGAFFTLPGFSDPPEDPTSSVYQPASYFNLPVRYQSLNLGLTYRF